jgi:hypothetical protein
MRKRGEENEREKRQVLVQISVGLPSFPKTRGILYRPRTVGISKYGWAPQVYVLEKWSEFRQKETILLSAKTISPIG